LQTRRFDVDRDPVGTKTSREPCCGTHQRRRVRPRPDAHHQPVARLPDRVDRPIRAVFAHLGINAIRRAPQRQFAQRDQVAFAKEIANRVLRLLRHVDLAVAQPFEQFFGRKIDQCDFIGLIQNAIRDRLKDADLRDLPHDVVQAFQMLDIDRGIDVNTRVQQFMHVLPAFQMTSAGDVRMSEFVDE